MPDTDPGSKKTADVPAEGHGGVRARLVRILRGLTRPRWPLYTLAGAVLLAAIAGASLGTFLRLGLPDVRDLEDYNPPVMSRVYAADGSIVATFAEERRELVDFHEIPEVFRNALVSVEDSSFHSHIGIDLRGIARAAVQDLIEGRLAQGASTLTQQLARNLFLQHFQTQQSGFQKSIRRKLQEAVLAMEIERQYSKQEILRFYCNQIYMGHGRYGLGAASRYYFGKPASELDLIESATIAGLIQRPNALSPYRNMDASLRRRNHVLRRMVEVGFLDPSVAEEAMKQPIITSDSRRVENPAPYFVENVRRWLQERYGSTTLYKEGFEVRTTLDPAMQQAANAAVEAGLRELDRRQGWRGEFERVPADEDPTVWEPPSWTRGIEEGDVHDAVVISVDDNRATVRLGPYLGVLGKKQIDWTKKKKPSDVFEIGDIARVRLTAVAEDGTPELALEQEPQVEAALIALDPKTGAVRALVGGFDFERSEFDRASQARRQTGSAFKPLVFAAALDQGWTLADTLLDEPTVFLDRRNPDPYQPENYSLKYYETVTLRTAMEKSANIATVKLLDQIGYEAVIDTARRLGVSGELQPFPSLALGTFEISLLELTSAYATFANQGVRVEPHLVQEVRNRQGALIAQVEADVRDAVSSQIAYLMNRVLSGVISDGTGRAAKSLGSAVAGKTGTTDNNTDAWFVGYTPDLAVGVWVGFDEPRSLGSRETGAGAALPIWQSFMEQVLADTDTAQREFPVPPGVTIVAVDRDTGLKASREAACSNVFSEVFVRGSEPTDYCSRHDHLRLALPYTFQRYPIDENGALVIPQAELAALLEEELDAFLVGDHTLEVHTDHGAIILPLLITQGGADANRVPEHVRRRFDVERWTGVDGRKAQIQWLR